MTVMNSSSAAKEHKDCRTRQGISTNEKYSQYLGNTLFEVLWHFMQQERF